MPPTNTNTCTDGNPTPRAPRLPSDTPPPRRPPPTDAQATAREGESSSAVSVPNSPSQDHSDRDDATTSRRAVLRAIFDSLPFTARAQVAGVLLAWLRLVAGYAVGSVSRATADRATDELFESLHERGLLPPAEAAAGAWFGSGPSELFALVDCEPGIGPLAGSALAELVELLSAAEPRRLVRLPLDAPPRRAPDPREALVRGVVCALPPSCARNALRGAISFLRTLDGIAALSLRLERSPDPSPSQRARDEESIRCALRAAGSVAAFGGRRRTALARRTVVAAVIGLDPTHAAQLAADSGFPTRLRSGIALLERALLDVKGGAA